MICMLVGFARGQRAGKSHRMGVTAAVSPMPRSPTSRLFCALIPQGEFGIGTGGLRHPNTWGGDPTGEEAKFLDGQMVRGYEGLAVYLGNATVSAEEGVPRAPTASLWITGPRFDVWGWEQQKYANPAAQVVAKGYLADAAKQ